MKKICFVFLTLVICSFSLVSVYAKNTEIKNMIIDVDIDKQGNAYIKETWNMSVYEGTEVYKVLDNMDESVVSNLRVKDDTGKQYQVMKEWDVDLDFDEKANQCGIVQDGDRYELCFGIGKYGERTYTFEYRVSNFIKQYNDNQGLNFAFFSDMSLDIDNAIITISSPYDFNEENSQIWGFGYSGKVYYNDGDVILEKTNSIDDERMQLLMRINEPLFTNTFEHKGDFQKILDDALEDSEYEDESYQQNGYYTAYPYKDYSSYIFLGIGSIVILGGIIAVIAISYGSYSSSLEKYRFQDNRDFEEDDEDVYKDIPCDGDLFKIYYLANKGNIIIEDKGGLIASLLLKWLYNGWIVYEKREEKSFLSFHKDGFAIDLNKTVPCDHPLEEELFDFFVEASGKNQILETDEFEEWCIEHEDRLDQWFESIEQHVEYEYRRSGMITTETNEGKWLWKTVQRNREVLDVSLREDMVQIAGFKHYLESEEYQNEKAQMDTRLWEKYLIYASLLGVYDEVEEQLEAIYPNYMQIANMHALYTSHMIYTMSTDSYSSAHQSSSISGGGSSFSGGGGGGVR